MRSLLLILCMAFNSASYAQNGTHVKKNNHNNTAKDNHAVVSNNIKKYIPNTNNDIKCIAETIYSESRGESRLGQIAVGQTIITRSKQIFNKPVCKVIRGQYTSKKVPSDDKDEFYHLASDILNGNVRNPIGILDSFDSHLNKRHKKGIHLGHHWFYQSLKKQSS